MLMHVDLQHTLGTLFEECLLIMLMHVDLQHTLRTLFKECLLIVFMWICNVHVAVYMYVFLMAVL